MRKEKEKGEEEGEERGRRDAFKYGDDRGVYDEHEPAVVMSARDGQYAEAWNKEDSGAEDT